MGFICDIQCRDISEDPPHQCQIDFFFLPRYIVVQSHSSIQIRIPVPYISSELSWDDDKWKCKTIKAA